MNSLLLDFVEAYVTNGVEAAEEVLKGRTESELGTLRCQVSVMSEMAEDAKPIKEPEDD